MRPGDITILSRKSWILIQAWRNNRAYVLHFHGIHKPYYTPWRSATGVPAKCWYCKERAPMDMVATRDVLNLGMKYK